MAESATKRQNHMVIFIIGIPVHENKVSLLRRGKDGGKEGKIFCPLCPSFPVSPPYLHFDGLV